MMEYPVELTLLRIGYMGIYFVFMSILCDIWRKEKDKRRFEIFMFIPLIVVQLIFFYVCIISFWDRAMTLWAALIMFSDAVFNVLLDGLIFIFLRQIEQNELENSKEKQLRIQLSRQKQYREEAEEKRKKADCIKENIRMELKEAGRMLRERNQEKFLEVLANVNERMKKEYRYSNNHVVDAIVSNKAGKCEEKGIDLHTELDIPKNLPATNAELCVIFANLLDNAIRACENCPSLRIRLAARERGGYLVIRQENTFDGTVENRREGILSEHGLGLGIVEQIAVKYQGSLKTEADEGVFVTTVLMKM